MSSAAWDRAEQASSVTFFILEVKSFRVSRCDSLNGSMLSRGVLSNVKHEGGGVHQCMELVILGELSYGQPFIPVVLTLVHEELKELFNSLIDPLCLAISLGW